MKIVVGYLDCAFCLQNDLFRIVDLFRDHQSNNLDDKNETQIKNCVNTTMTLLENSKKLQSKFVACLKLLKYIINAKSKFKISEILAFFYFVNLSGVLCRIKLANKTKPN